MASLKNDLQPGGFDYEAYDEQTGFGQVMARVLDHLPLSMKGAMAYVALTTFVQREKGHKDEGKCFAHRETAARRARMSIKTFDRAVKELEELGLVVVERRKHANGGYRSSLYRVLDGPGELASIRPAHEGVASDCRQGRDNVTPPAGQIDARVETDCPEGGDRLTHLEQTTEHTTEQTTLSDHVDTELPAPASRSRGTSEVQAEEEQDVQEPVADHIEEEPELKNFTTSLDEQPDASFVVQSAEELTSDLDKIFADERPQQTSGHPVATETMDEALQVALDALGPVSNMHYESRESVERRPVPVLTPEEIEHQVAARRKQPTEAQKKHQEFLERQAKFDAEYEAANPLPRRAEDVDMVQKAREALKGAPRRRGGRRKQQPAAPENTQTYEGIKHEFGPYLGEPHKAQELVGTPYDPNRLFKAYEEALAERGLTMDWQYSGELRRFISAFLFHTGGDEFRVAKALQSVLDNESVTHPHNSKVVVTFAGHALVSGLSFIGSKALGIHLRRSA
ncbi:hypothetical protein UK23_29610 [Lentzea aerocolonigenes]|uniref:Uncharacterized protein n=1 Tax=Lentzea aerocolonigenes TaxID=68170 RepID=A0A0F0GP72_LENAE|nr:hypothetical protein [Lentzea aerocolonigenes]KJK44381.1 hypothetical protein UK23_29610 [Lentzea aerocolonigenes]